MGLGNVNASFNALSSVMSLILASSSAEMSSLEIYVSTFLSILFLIQVDLPDPRDSASLKII